MRAQVNSLNQVIGNAQDGISLTKTADGAFEEVHNILLRISTLALQVASDTLKDSDRAEIQKEISNLKAEIDGIARTTEFNSKKLPDGSMARATTAQGAVFESVALTDVSTGGIASSPTALINHGDAQINTFGLASGDEIKISGIVGGEAKEGILTITDITTLGDLVGQI